MSKQPPPGDGGQNVGLTVFSYLISGMLAYGGLGWLFGLGLTLWLVIYRYGRS
jgi:hypothetical protein